MESLRLDSESQQILALLQRQERRLQALLTQVQDIIDGNGTIAMAVIRRLRQLEDRVRTLEDEVKKSKKGGEKR